MPLFLNIQYGEKLYRTRPSAFHKGQYFPVWNHKFFINIYEGLADFELTITEGDSGDGVYEEEMIGEAITNTYEMMDLQKGTRDGGSNWFQFNHPETGNNIGKILIRVKFRDPEHHKEYL
jgi:hypothetical protein